MSAVSVAEATVTETIPTVAEAYEAQSEGKKVGQGSYRMVFHKEGSRWAFKFNKPDMSGGIGDNASEFRTYNILREKVSLPNGVRIPEMYLLEDDILATEYIKGSHPTSDCSTHWGGQHYNKCNGRDTCWATLINDNVVRLVDMHRFNVMWSENGFLYIVDLGHGSY